MHRVSQVLPLFSAILLGACGGGSSVTAESSGNEDEIRSVTADEDPAAREVVDEDAAGARQYVATFRDREIDLEPYVQGFPYSGFAIDLEHGLTTYSHTTPDGTFLRLLELPDQGALDPTTGDILTGIDWSTRNLWGAEWHAPSGKFLVMTDEANEERINIYMLEPDTGQLEQLTFNDYTYGMGWNEDESRLAYIARNGAGEPFDSCLHVMDPATGDDDEYFCDGGGDDRFTWSNLHFSPDERFLLMRIQHEGDRNKTNLAIVDLAASEPEWDMLLEPGVMRYSIWAVEDSFDGDTFVYVSAESGFDEVYRYDLATRSSTQLTELGEEISSLEFEDGVIAFTIKRPHETVLRVIDASEASVLFEETLPVEASIRDFHGTSLALSVGATDLPFQIDLIEFTAEGDVWTSVQAPLVEMPQELREALVQCNIRRVEFPTFDAHADGEPRMLHAFYLEPKSPPAQEERLVRITSFYGGGNYYSTSSHILCEAGVATFSPAVRGSWGFGAEFAALNDGDLGGDEIVDLFYAARWLESEEGYTPQQIGVYGGSHGGYATMRALTFPPETNDRNDSYPFGFGMSHAGFSNIINFYETCNIPDWVILEAGDPETESEKLLERSPISHVELLNAPLLLTHGENDQRVPVMESRDFASAVEDVGGTVTYVEFAGQGHGISGLDNTLNYYQTVFAFLETL